MYEFRIHPKAVINFNSKASSIVKKVAFMPRKTDRQFSGTEQPQPFRPDLHVSGVITKADIVGDVDDIKICQEDRDGNRISYQWYDKSSQFSISRQNYSDVRDLAAQLLKNKDINSAISRETVEELICRWVRQSYTKNTEQSFIDFFRTETEKCVRKIQVWAPIRSLCIQKAFQLGVVTFEPISRNQIDNWEKQLLINAKDKEHKEQIKRLFEKDIRPVQGYTAAVIEVTAEEKKAYDLLLDEANRALGLFRSFTPSAFLPNMTSSFVLWGTGHIDQSFIFTVSDRKFERLQKGFIGPGNEPVIVNSAIIDESFRSGLHRLHEILVSKNRSDLEKAVLEAVLLYSRCTISKDPADKLVYILVGLESILLKDSSEPITHNLSDRIAFLVGRDLQQRRNIVQSVKEAYKLRSSFIHHGASIESLEILQKFMQIAWYVVLALIDSTRQLKTRQELLDGLDDKRLS